MRDRVALTLGPNHAAREITAEAILSQRFSAGMPKPPGRGFQVGDTIPLKFNDDCRIGEARVVSVEDRGACVLVTFDPIMDLRVGDEPASPRPMSIAEGGDDGPEGSAMSAEPPVAPLDMIWIMLEHAFRAGYEDGGVDAGSHPNDALGVDECWRQFQAEQSKPRATSASDVRPENARGTD